MMGTEDDPTDGKAVASSIFIAVAVYGVCTFYTHLSPFITLSPRCGTWLTYTNRHSSSSAAHKPGCTCERVEGGRLLCGDDIEPTQ